MKHLNTIQTVIKVAKIIATIALICSMIGACGCVIGLSLLGLSSAFSFIESFYSAHKEMLVNSSFGVYHLVTGIVLCVAEIIISYLTLQYCKHELEEGTPFTYNSAKEIFRLGLFMIFVPFGASIVNIGIRGIFLTFDLPVGEFSSEVTQNIGFGVVLLFISVLCKHGAELAEKVQQRPEQNNTPLKKPQENEESKS